MLNPYSRTELVIGREAVEKLHRSRVAVFGLGGVGGSAVEALARSGVGTLDLIDNDQVCMTNLNRQQFATVHTVGKQKTDAAEERIHDIDPAIIVHKYPVFYLPEKKDLFPFSEWDYIIDCIDTVTAKLDIIEEAKRLNIPILSSMGCGNRLDPSQLRIMDLYETSGDPLSRIMRHECRKRGIESLDVVCSLEEPVKPMAGDASDAKNQRTGSKRRSIPGSTAFVPPAAGILAASFAVRKLIQE